MIRMQLSKRLQAVADMVTPGSRVADIGCDHAYTAAYLLSNKISPYVVAMDINRGPLERAARNVEKFGVKDKVSIRLSDGLKMLDTGEVDTILIAGMGGRLMLKILNDRMDIVASARELVLQPQSEIHLIREALNNLGYAIIKENMIKEDGKYYAILKVKCNVADIDINDYRLVRPEHFYFGRRLLEERNPVMLEYLQENMKKYQKIYDSLAAKTSERAAGRLDEVAEMLGLIRTALNYYEGEEG